MRKGMRQCNRAEKRGAKWYLDHFFYRHTHYATTSSSRGCVDSRRTCGCGCAGASAGAGVVGIARQSYLVPFLFTEYPSSMMVMMSRIFGRFTTFWWRWWRWWWWWLGWWCLIGSRRATNATTTTHISTTTTTTILTIPHQCMFAIVFIFFAGRGEGEGMIVQWWGSTNHTTWVQTPLQCPRVTDESRGHEGVVVNGGLWVG